MIARDAVDMRLLQLLAEAGRVAVHELAATVGLDARDVAARLVALSASGLPLLVGVECDQKALRGYVTSAQQAQQYGYAHPPSGQFPAQQPAAGPSSGPNTRQPASGVFRAPPSGQFPVAPPPVRPYARRPEPQNGAEARGADTRGTESRDTEARAEPPSVEPRVAQPRGTELPGPPSGSVPAQQSPASRPEPEPESSGVDPISVWGPPQSSSWARGDEPTLPASRPRNQRRPASGKRGGLGDTLLGLGPRGEQAQLKLVEITDPADELLAGTELAPVTGHRAILVHLELTNGASTPFPQRADEHLQVITADGERFAPTPAALPEKPAHRSGLRAGDTAAGHSVFLIPANAEVKTVRWASAPEDEAAVSWRL